MSESTAIDLLIICTKPPYTDGSSSEAIELALASASFDRNVELLFVEQGVLQLLKEQKPEAIGRKNIAKQLKAFPMFGIESIKACQHSLETFGLETPNIIDTPTVKSLDEHGLANIFAHASNVIRF